MTTPRAGEPNRTTERAIIDLSADLGEGAAGEDDVWPLITSANVACGGHVGDDRSMREAVQRAIVLGVKLGAHPSYPDRPNFGRRSMTIDAGQLQASLIAQVVALQNIAAAEGSTLHHVKPHGALYNDAHTDAALAAIVIGAIRAISTNLAIVCSATSQMAVVARACNMPVVREAFADRRYEPDGSLTPRSISGSLLAVDEAADQAESLVRKGIVTARDGAGIPIEFETICVHADLEGAADRLVAIRHRLSRM